MNAPAPQAAPGTKETKTRAIPTGPAVNWDSIPLWPVKKVAAFLGISGNRVQTLIKKGFPEGAPKIAFSVDGRKYYGQADTVKTFKAWMDKNPDKMSAGVGRKGSADGSRKYFIYVTAEQAAKVKQTFPGVRFDIANKAVAKAEAEAAAK